MAKAPWLLKGARGKVGTIVVQNGVAGSVVRMHKEKIKNPRTDKQMRQRAIFANVVKFYKHADQAFFKFAFENKRKAESDYNAFVRNNTKASTIFNYPTTQNPLFPAIGNKWMMTQGSLGVAESTLDGSNVKLAVTGLTSAANTWGKVSQAIIEAFPGVQAGDFITCVGIRSAVETIDDEPTKASVWDIHQFVLDPDDTEALPDLLSVQSGYLVYETIIDADFACGGCITISRDTSKGVKVTTAFLELNSTALAIFEATKGEAYLADAMNSWKTSGKAILQGSLVQ